MALGTYEIPKHVDVVIQPNEMVATKSEDGTLYVGSKPEGKTLGLLALWLDSNGELTRHYATQLALTGDVAESEPVRQLLTDFYRIGDQDSTLKGVQCETCHGPGKQHVGNPKKTNIRNGADTGLCLECHDTKHSPGFSDVVALHTKDVDHSREPMNLEELLESRIARVGKPTLELFIMSYCPFGVQAEEKIIPIVKEFGDKIDFKLQFIAAEKETVSLNDITPFTSLHGYPEVAENIRQLLIAQEYPDKYLDYILCRGKKLDKSWESCAEKLGIDVAKIQRLFDSPAAEQMFRENIKRAEELGIKASPTILVDNHQFRATQLLRASGTPCQ